MVGSQRDGRDPFADITLDEGFVQSARVHEASAAERSWCAGYATPPPTPRRPRHRRLVHRLRTSPAVRWCLVVAAVAGLWAAANTLAVDSEPSSHWSSGAPLTATAGTEAAPTPRRATSRRPLGTPPSVSPDAGPHVFVGLQPGSDEPIAYDPCRPLPYVVNTRHAPPGTASLVIEAVQEVAAATGLVFHHEGSSEEVPDPQRRPYQPDRYGDRWAPLLIAWSNPPKFGDLEGDIAGIGGSTSLSTGPRDPTVYVTGLVVLDGPQLAPTMSTSSGREGVRGVILHELAHAVGLDHVDDPTQLMHATAGRVAGLQPGDLAGLARLGAGPCIGSL